MQLRQVAGSIIAAASALSLVGYAATWLYRRQIPLEVWPFFLCTAVVFVSGAVSAHVLKPHYKVDRVLQIPKLKPFLSDRDYKSIWAAFAFTMIALVAGMLQIAGGIDAARITLQMFAAGSFGFLYTDAMILLRAEFPSQSPATQ
jgi:hypothetical protein